MSEGTLVYVYVKKRYHSGSIVRFPGWRKREEKKRQREETVNAIIIDNASREKRARGRSLALRNGASELVMKYQGRKGKKKFIYGYKKELKPTRTSSGETIYGNNYLDLRIREHGDVLRIIKGKKRGYFVRESGEHIVFPSKQEWAVLERECNWPNNYRTTNHIIIETNKGITGMDNIGDKKTSVKELLSGLESDLKYMNRNLPKKKSRDAKRKVKVSKYRCVGCMRYNRVLDNYLTLCDSCQEHSDY